MNEQNLTLAGTESRMGLTIIRTQEGVNLVYDMQGKSFQTTAEYCSCGKEPCIHQRAIYGLEEDLVSPHQTLQERRIAPHRTREVVQQAYAQESPPRMGLQQAIVIYEVTGVALFFLRGISRLLGKGSHRQVTSGIVH
jgi:hypothetical protein